jgi:hypothetical protein
VRSGFISTWGSGEISQVMSSASVVASSPISAATVNGTPSCSREPSEGLVICTVGVEFSEFETVQATSRREITGDTG